MLPPSFESSYQSYKTDTNCYITWLADTGRACGFTPSASGSPRHGAKTYRLTNADILACAKAVSRRSPTKKGFEVPWWVLKAGERSVKLRQKFSEWFAVQAPDQELAESNRRHELFISVLQQSLSLLRGLPISTSATLDSASPTPIKTPLREQHTNKKQSPGGLNRFGALKVNKTKQFVEETTTTPKLTRTTVLPHATEHSPESRGSEADSAAMFAIFCCIEDLHRLEDRVIAVWKDFVASHIDLPTTCFTTNTAFELATQLIAELQYDFPELTDWETTCVAMLAGKHSEQTDDEDSGHSLEWLYTRSALNLHAAFGVCKLHRSEQAPQKSKADLESLTELPLVRNAGKQDLSPWKVFRYYWHGSTSSGTRGPHDTDQTGHKQPNSSWMFRPELVSLVKASLAPNTFLSVEDHMTKCLRETALAWKGGLKVPVDVVFMSQVWLSIVQVLASTPNKPQVPLKQNVELVMSAVSKQVTDTSLKVCSCRQCDERQLKQFREACDLFKARECLAQLPNVLSDLKTWTAPDLHFPILQHNPIICGLLMLRYELLLQNIGIELSNLSETTMGLAHLYNACRATGDLSTVWEDMEEVIRLCNESRIFLGKRPTDPISFRSRYILTAGISLRAFASNKHGDCSEHKKRRQRAHWIGAARRRRLLEVDMPFLNTFSRQVTASPHGHFTCLSSDIQDVVNPRSSGASKGARENLTPLQYLDRISGIVRGEYSRTGFYFLLMSQRCELLLMDLCDTLQGPLDEEGWDIKDVGYHASVVYDIMFASYFACSGCHNTRGNPEIMKLAGEIIADFLIEHRSGALVKAANAKRQMYMPVQQKAVKREAEDEETMCGEK